MLILDPDCCTPSQAQIWESEGFSILSVYNDRTLRSVAKPDINLVVPDYFPEISYDYLIKPRVIGGKISVNPNDINPDYQEEGWVDLENALLNIRQRRTDQDSVLLEQPEDADKGELHDDTEIVDLPSRFNDIRRIANSIVNG